MYWSKKVKEALGRTEFMALSTSEAEGNWTNPVEYHYSEKLDIYFVSKMDSKHVQNIIANPRVSAAIFKTERFENGEVLGIQLAGTAKQITDPAEVAEAVRYYGRTFGNEWHFFKITPTELWIFDSREFGEERRQVDLNNLNL